MIMTMMAVLIDDDHDGMAVAARVVIVVAVSLIMIRPCSTSNPRTKDVAEIHHTTESTLFIDYFLSDYKP